MEQKRENLLKEVGINIPLENMTEKAWMRISKYEDLTEEFIIEFKMFLFWSNITLYSKLTNKILLECQHFIDWDILSESKDLSEEFIEEYADKLTWQLLSVFQKMSDEFLIKHKDKMIWVWYFKHQVASYPIVKKFITRTHFENVDQFNATGLTEIQKIEIDRLLKLKYMF